MTTGAHQMLWTKKHTTLYTANIMNGPNSNMMFCVSDVYYWLHHSCRNSMRRQLIITSSYVVHQYIRAVLLIIPTVTSVCECKYSVVQCPTTLTRDKDTQKLTERATTPLSCV